MPSCFPSHGMLWPLAICWGLLPALPAYSGDIGFSRDVQPILAEYCLQCHGPDEHERQAGLRLDQAETGSVTAIIAGNPEESDVIARLTSDDQTLVMPPPEMDKRPSDREIDSLRRWIASGAGYEEHWSYLPIRKPELPQTQRLVSTEIDRFIVSALEAKGLTLSESVNRRQLIRRASFDLLGLPPTPEEVDAFVNDPDGDAFATVIDRLLESPRYGERWGRHWLDLARYADTHGGSAIGYQRFAFSYTYRDYVIRAFNSDTPYNEFIREQLAADQLDLPENDPALAALGFLTVGMQFRSRHDLIDDQIDVVTRGLLGMTVACARCHDHKFDAIPTTDYYAMYATLASSEPPDDLPVVGQPEPSGALRDYRRQLDKRQRIHRDMARDQSAVMRSRLRNQVGLYLTEVAKGTPEQDLSAAFLSYRTDDIRPVILNHWRDYLSNMSADDPVFGLWVRLFDVPADHFAARRDELVQIFKSENGDPAAFAETHRLSVEAPKWNPRVLETIDEAKPASMVELASVYGNLFADVHQTWLKGLLSASLEAAPGGEILTDEDAGHAVINSAIEQQLRHHLYEPGTPTAISDELAVRMLNRTVSDNLNGKRGTIDSLNLNSPGSPPRAMILEEAESPPTFHVFQRGKPLNRGEPVQAHFLTAISSDTPQAFENGRRRLGLANAIIDPANPLTRRVIVNWIWGHHFGLGLVRTPDDLGTRGTPPTHPELLDYLAAVFAEDGWSIKRMHRRIMLSATYRQAAIEDDHARNVDPDNELLWRMPRRRLEMEAMRDAMLAVSGELDLSNIGGRPFDFESTPIVPRRSVYGFINRDIISTLSSTFDGADPTSCTVKRPETTVPQQTLYALNSSFIQDRAARVAQLATATAETETDRLHWLFLQLYGRPPSDAETELAIGFVGRPSEAGSESGQGPAGESADHPDRWAQLVHAMLASNEFVFVD